MARQDRYDRQRPVYDGKIEPKTISFILALMFGAPSFEQGSMQSLDPWIDMPESLTGALNYLLFGEGKS